LLQKEIDHIFLEKFYIYQETNKHNQINDKSTTTFQ